MSEYLFFIGPIALIIAVILIINRKTKNNTSYDERQLIARNNAYRWAFTTLLAYFVSGELASLLRDSDWCTPECNIGLGLLVSLGTFVFIAISNDAYAPAVSSSRTKSNLLIILLLGGCQLFIGISSVIECGIMQNGLLNLPVTLCVGCLMIVVVMAQLIKSAFNRKAAKDED